MRTGERVDEALIEQFQGGRYVTGVLADLDTRGGELRWVSFGQVRCPAPPTRPRP
ncbi:hypothetical protein ACWGMA_16565 [Streptomyces asiaticus]